MNVLLIDDARLEQESGLSYECCEENSTCCGDNFGLPNSSQREIHFGMAPIELAPVGLVEMNGDSEVTRFIGESTFSGNGHSIFAAAHCAEGFSGTRSGNRPSGDFLAINQKFHIELTANTLNSIPARLDGAEWIDDRDFVSVINQSWSDYACVQQSQGEQGPENDSDFRNYGSAVEDRKVRTNNQNEISTGNAVGAPRSKSFLGNAAHMSIVPQVSDSKGVSRG